MIVGLLPTGHWPMIGTLLMTVKSIGLFKTIFPSPCSRVNGLFGHIGVVVLFYSIFFSWPLKFAELYIYLQPNFLLP